MCWLYAWCVIVSEANSGSGWNLTITLPPTISEEYVPIPFDVLTLMNGDDWIVLLCWSATTIKFWTTVVSPTPIFIIDFWLNWSTLSNSNTVATPTVSFNCESNFAVLSVPGIWPGTKNLCVPTPAAVVPIPIVFVLTSKLLLILFSNWRLITPPETFKPNVPMFAPENDDDGIVS